MPEPSIAPHAAPDLATLDAALAELRGQLEALHGELLKAPEARAAAARAGEVVKALSRMQSGLRDSDPPAALGASDPLGPLEGAVGDLGKVAASLSKLIGPGSIPASISAAAPALSSAASGLAGSIAPRLAAAASILETAAVDAERLAEASAASAPARAVSQAVLDLWQDSRASALSALPSWPSASGAGGATLAQGILPAAQRIRACFGTLATDLGRPELTQHTLPFDALEAVASVVPSEVWDAVATVTPLAQVEAVATELERLTTQHAALKQRPAGLRAAALGGESLGSDFLHGSLVSLAATCTGLGDTVSWIGATIPLSLYGEVGGTLTGRVGAVLGWGAGALGLVGLHLDGGVSGAKGLGAVNLTAFVTGPLAAVLHLVAYAAEATLVGLEAG